ncbi:hypothetical protein CAPTEDRAFT_211883 [Capitella teleta]|uniref:UDP-glucuronosyltransferase n=1 Tax=Capitella teleta TaxID=283909 RepID=R7U8D9_CAPTE|nr:hypothetical protein CAPTEDRAFT_211883 [Capitella teleta]|eukprot:ELT99355.1 hypothetical protein CAPTEDRAFT_211883 [Capitella teleta]
MRLLFLICCLIEGTTSVKILLMPVNHGSHARFFSLVGQTLQEEGHVVHVLLGDNFRHHSEERGLRVVSMGMDLKYVLEAVHEKLFDSSKWGMWQLLKAMKDKGSAYCEAALSQGVPYEVLEAEKYDLVLIDNIDPGRCMYVVPYRLNVPYISLGARHDPWSARVPALPSSEGQIIVSTLSANSTFRERLLNTVASLAFWVLFPPSFAVDPSYLKRFAPNRPETTFDQIYQDSEMWIINMDTMCSDWPRVHAFHYQFIAGLGWTPAKPLPAGDMQSFADGADNGLIVVSFGSALKTIPKEMMHVLMDALRDLPQRVLMRFDGEHPANTPANVMLTSWLPQNDLLGHNNTRLFVTHGGNNGQLEGLFHGVPMLTLPVFGDQFYNARRASLRGHGLSLDLNSSSAEQVRDAITELLSDPKYRKSVQRCSRILLDMPEPRKALSFWVNHVLKFGGSHLKPSSMQLPLWKFFMLDVAAFLAVSAAIVSACIFMCCRCTAKRCCRRQSKSKQD